MKKLLLITGTSSMVALKSPVIGWRKMKSINFSLCAFLLIASGSLFSAAAVTKEAQRMGLTDKYDGGYIALGIETWEALMDRRYKGLTYDQLFAKLGTPYTGRGESDFENTDYRTEIKDAILGDKYHSVRFLFFDGKVAHICLSENKVE